MTSNLQVSVTPLFGGKGDLSGACSLLELGSDAKILLDCGMSLHQDDMDENILSRLHNLNLIILSHADTQHLSALPIIQRILSKQSKPVPILCTLPVHKFGLMCLYDLYLNQNMEGKSTTDTNKSKSKDILFDLDDVDNAFSCVQTVKYSQQLSLNDIHNLLNYNPTSISPKKSYIYFCAYSSGRTIGGTIWRIRYEHSDIVYAMDINLKKDITLNGAAIDLLPKIPPALLIVEGGSLKKQNYGNRKPNTNSLMSNILQNVSDTKATKKSSSIADEFNKIITTVMVTLREGGNVLIPCDTASRTLEYLYLFGKYWYDNKLGIYHLIYLSHMSTNVFEYAMSQLEWMNDSLSKDFYNGKPNPFDIKPLTLLHTIQDMDKNYHGPKVVFATDISLSFGLSKELLLRWGGDPKNKVIFLDYSHEGSIASIIRNQLSSPPIVISVTRPQRVELQGEELVEYIKEREKQKRLRDEAVQRQLLLKELNLLEADRDEEEDDENVMNNAENTMIVSNVNNSDTDEINNHLKRSNSDTATVSNANTTSSKRLKLQSLYSKRFTEPKYPMFQSQYTIHTSNEYGIYNSDIQFQDIIPYYLQQKSNKKSYANSITNSNISNRNISTIVPIRDRSDIDNSIPHKIIAIQSKIQLTCQFYEYAPIYGRSDGKAIQSVISKVNPSKVMILRGLETDCYAIMKYTQSRNISTATLPNLKSLSYTFKANRLRMQIIQSLLPSSMKTIFPYSHAASTNQSSMSSSHMISDGSKVLLCAMNGYIEANDYESSKDGIKVVKFISKSIDDMSDNTDNEKDIVEVTAEGIDGLEDADNVGSKEEEDDRTVGYDDGKSMSLHDSNSDNDTESNLISDKTNLSYLMSHNKSSDGKSMPSMSAVSVGEIMLSNLKTQLEQEYHMNVEFRIGSSGGILVVGKGDHVVTMSRNNDNKFLIEGLPSNTYYTIRKCLYNHLAFL